MAMLLAALWSGVPTMLRTGRDSAFAQFSDRAARSHDHGLAGAPAGDRARCPGCGAGLAPRGKHQRSVLTTGGEAVALAREYAACPSCGAGLFPPGRRAGAVA